MMDTRVLAVFLVLCGCSSKVVTIVPVAVASGNLEKIEAKPEPVAAPTGSALAPVQEFDFGEDPDLNSHSESR